MKFTAALASLIVAVSAQYHGGHGLPSGGLGLPRGGHGLPRGGHGLPRGGLSSGRRGIHNISPRSGYDGGRGGQRTYGWKKDIGYGIYNFQAHSKPLIGDDGYKLKKRSDPYTRNYERVFAKCILNDPDEETYVTGLIYLSQAPRSDKTQVWGNIQGANYANLMIGALGDLRDGCDSAGKVWNPFVSQYGTAGYHAEQYNQEAPGALGSVGEGKVDISANVDLSGTHSILGRSMVVTNPHTDDRLACCTIGLAAAPKQSYGGHQGLHGHGGHRGHGGHGGYY